MTIASNTTIVGAISPFEGSKGWSDDVVVVSPGQDGIMQTLFGSPATEALGDDVAYVVRGATR